jgi:hypothetical protein
MSDIPFEHDDGRLAAPGRATPARQRFEVQFHTPSSLFVKEDLTHGLYERYRAPTTSDREIRAITETNRLIFRRIPQPDGASSAHYRPEAEREIDE